MQKIKKLLACISASCLILGSAATGSPLFPQGSHTDTAYALAEYDPDLVMHYDSQAGTYSTDNAWDNAESFYRALPLGNGRIGAMVYGNCPTEWIDLNECTVWSAGPGSNDREGAADNLSTVQSLLSQGKYQEANDIIGSEMIGGGQAKYQKVGMVKLAFGHENVTDYSRQLDMNTAVVSTSYTCQGKKYLRESFVSYPDQVMVTRITCDSPSSVSLTAGYDGLLNGTVSTEGDNTMIANGHGDDDCWTRGAVYYSARTKVINTGGSVSASNGKVTVNGSDSVMILTAIRTNFIDAQTVNGDEKGDCAADMKRVENMTYDELYSRHTADFQSLFKRVDIDLGGDSSVTNSKTVETRISEFGKTNDPKMVKTLFQYGRYLMISASRDAQSMNLQGIWNKYSSPAWGSKATTNINYEMNYWPAFTTNLSECFEPFVEKAKALSVAGNRTAKTQYGISDGWVLHHNTDLWNRCAPIDGTWGLWPVGGAWISNMLYDAYNFNQDTEYLEEVYPVIQGSAAFLSKLMTKQNIDGQDYMVISPSASPELQLPGYPWDTNVYCSYGVTMDNSICRELFQDVVDASAVLGKQSSLTSELQSRLSMIKPSAVGSYGQLQEWAYDWDNPNETHRHISHIYGLFPGNEYSPATNETIADAAAVALNHRGDAGTGWSEAWKLNCWARLMDGEHAYDLVKLLISPVNGTESGRLYANLWDAHPPFQIDGNFGFTSGIAEMLLQSRNNEITLLPALPKAWSEGHANGLCARGGFEITEMNWSGGQLSDVTIQSNAGCVCNLRYGSRTISFETEKGGIYHLNGLLRFTEKPEMLANVADGSAAAGSLVTYSKACDGDDSTAMTTLKLSNDWIAVELDEDTPISRWTVKFGGVNGNINANARDFRLQISDDGENWTDADSVYGNTKSVVTRNIKPFTAKYARLYIETSSQDTKGAGEICEFELWGESDESSSVSAFSRIEAEKSDFLLGGIQIETSEIRKDIGYIQNGSAVVVCSVDFGGGASAFNISASSTGSGGTVEVRLGSRDGNLIGKCDIPSTDDWQDYHTYTCNVEPCTGEQDLYLLFTGDDGYLFNIDWFEFEPDDTAVYGDADCDGTVAVNDAVLILQTLADPSGYTLTAKGKVNADCFGVGDGVDAQDALAVQMACADLTTLPVMK